MARSGSTFAPLAALVALMAMALWTTQLSFVPPTVAAAAAAAPMVAEALPDLDTSLTLAGTVEPLVMGIVMGTVPVTVLGLMVAAWLQFKKGPTLGL